MSMHTINQVFHKEGSDTCYLCYPMAPEVIIIPTPTTEEEAKSAMRIYEEAVKARPHQIMIPIYTSENHQLLFSRDYGITLTLGIDDYTSYTEAYTEECIHEFVQKDETYVTIVRKHIVEQMCSIAQQIWKATHDDVLPNTIMLRIDSSPTAKAEITDHLPSDSVRYFDVTHVSPNAKGLSLQPEIGLRMTGPASQLDEIQKEVDKINQDPDNSSYRLSIRVDDE